jgi:hypothetical protein
MRDMTSKIICLLIVVVIFYFIYKQSNTGKKMPMQKPRVSAAQLNANALRHPKAYMNADANMNENAQRNQHNPLDVDRLPLVEENSHIIPANEMIQMNYKDCNSQDQTEKELYTTDAPLFEKGPSKIVPMDINDSSHRRVNFY